MKYAKIYLPLLAIIIIKLSIEPLFKNNELGSENNPIKIVLTPSVDADKVTNSAEKLIDFLHQKTGYYFSAAYPASYIAVVEAFGSGKADFAAMNTFSYLLAHDKYGVEAKLLVVRRDGETSYKGQFIARADSGIDSLFQLNGKKIAYVDPASTSGYILPKALLNEKHVKPAEEVFAMKHDNVVMMVYQRQVDAGATYYSPPDSKTGEILDARARVVRQYPDIFSTVKIIGFTTKIPNDPFVFRKDFPQNIEKQIIEALLEFQATPEGKKVWFEAYSIEGLAPVSDSSYNQLRSMIASHGFNLEETLKKK